MSHYRMHRGWMDTPALNVKGEPFCRRAAWAWLIENANWKAAKIDIGGRTVEVQRGQLSYSYRYLSKAWNWSICKVQLFIDRLETDTMINTATNTGQLLITICNYEKYQAAADVPNTPSNTVANTLPIHKEYESKEGKKEEYKNGPITHIDSDSPRVSAEGLVGGVGRLTGIPATGRNRAIAEDWLRNGWDAELDILPAISGIVNTITFPLEQIRGFGFFTDAIDAFRARRLNPQTLPPRLTVVPPSGKPLPKAVSDLLELKRRSTGGPS